MIRALQKRFVVTAMIAISVLILLLLGAINAANIAIVKKEVERTMDILLEIEDGAGRPAPGPSFAPPVFPLDAPKNKYDTFLSSNYFVAQFDQSGALVRIDASRTSAVSEEAASELAAQAFAGESVSGKIGQFRYRLQKSRSGTGCLAVFLDTSAQQFSIFRVLLLSGLAGIACWGMMLVFVILLSKKAIRPIAENIERQKQFVTNAGHEIKTPLAIIQSNTEAMELYNGENKWTRNIREQTERLGGLMNRLLFLARMDEGAARVEATDFSLSALTEEALLEFAQPIAARGLSLNSDIQPDVFVRADRSQTEQLLSILLDNAVKYADTGGALWIELKKAEKASVLQIQNTCESLPDAPPDKLFDRFYRADAARTQKNGGYGVGLSMARSIVAANKGSIGARYEPPNRICFTVRL